MLVFMVEEMQDDLEELVEAPNICDQLLLLLLVPYAKLLVPPDELDEFSCFTNSLLLLLVGIIFNCSNSSS
jgi:hypothetical protein